MILADFEGIFHTVVNAVELAELTARVARSGLHDLSNFRRSANDLLMRFRGTLGWEPPVAPVFATIRDRRSSA